MAISQDASSLEYAAADLKSKEMVLQVVNKSGMALKHAGDMWRRDREIAEAAVRHTGAAIQFVAKEVVDAHPEIARTAAKRNLGAIQCIPEPLKSKLRNDPKIVAKAGRGLPPSAFWCHVGETLRKRVASAVSALRQHCGVSGTDEIKLTIHDEKSILQVAEELRERKEDQLNESITNLVVCTPLLTMFAGSSSCWDEEAGMTWNELPV
ncbi:expressed unknown protein [Seminavis robusta]|uniref:DUF4116 domain-containing protein n=1 Tax=Seminavis robusta TaxID=568900 RepID=A0A9N8F4A3_9STRA|nr:expressed unknown protein [Seminavis robusta]|eukprot:Sro4026_g352590.1 n/a (209) ;mRNA; r:2825-3451